MAAAADVEESRGGTLCEMSMEGCTYGSAAGFHLQTRDTEWGWGGGGSRGLGVGGGVECKRARERRRERKGGEVVTGLQV